jgi:hypothetical protein
VRTLATYLIHGDDGSLTAAQVTRELGLVPTFSVECGERRREHGLRAATSVWRLASSAGPETGVELSTSIARVLTLLEPVRPALWELSHAGYEFVWFCYLGSYGTEHAAELGRELLARILALPGDLLLDVYDEEPPA